jgi:hypothetical protein
MMRRILLAACLLSGSLPQLSAQKKIVLKQFRYNTVVDYLQQKDMQQLLTRHLNELFLKYQHTPLSDTTGLPLLHVQNLQDLNQKYNYRETGDTNMQLVVDVFEMSADYYFLSLATSTDSAMQATARIVYYINAVLKDGGKTLYNQPLYLIVKNNPGPGMGNESTIVPFLPKTFVELVRTGLNILLNPQNELDQVSVGIPPAFAMDNYLAPLLTGKRRIMVDTAKGVIQFAYQNSRQLLRSAEPMYEEIIWKGKKARPYPSSVIQTIQQAPDHNSSDFLFLRTDGRDVLNNRNYQLQLMLQVNRNEPYQSDPPLTGFMPGNLHVLYQEEDTLALFSISKNLNDTVNKIFPGQVYNGLDMNSVFVIEDAEMKKLISGLPVNGSFSKPKRNLSNTGPVSWNAQYKYVVKGKINGLDFSIYCGSNNSVKEYYLQKKLVCIAQGKHVPEKFVVFDASLTSDLLNPLLLIGFNPYFL